VSTVGLSEASRPLPHATDLKARFGGRRCAGDEANWPGGSGSR